MSSPWFRFGLPLGSAIVLAALLDTVMNLFSALLDIGDIIIYYSNSDVTLDPESVIWIFIMMVWIMSNLALLWYGVVLKGSAAMLTAWIITTLLCTMIILGVWLYVLIKFWGHWYFFWSEFYSIILYLIANAYVLYIGVQALEPLRQSEPVEPIGKGFGHIVKYYKDDLNLTAKCLLISELVFIGEYVFTRQMLKVAFGRGMAGHEDDLSAGIITEEYVIRFIRVVVAGAGVYILVKGKVPLLRYWGLFYLGTIIASICTFVYVLFQWKADHSFYTLAYYLLFFLNLLYRGGVLFVCMKVVRPYIASGSFLTLNEG